MDVPFSKMNGIGNDFVVIDVRKHKVAGADAARHIGDRHRGVGFDQLLVIGGPKNGADAEMRIWNSDGSEVEFLRQRHTLRRGRNLERDR